MTTDIYQLTSLPAVEGEAITKSDTDNFSTTARGIYVGVSGNVVVVTPLGALLTFVAVPAGQILPIRCVRVNSTDTTATSMIALF